MSSFASSPCHQGPAAMAKSRARAEIYLADKSCYISSSSMPPSSQWQITVIRNRSRNSSLCQLDGGTTECEEDGTVLKTIYAKRILEPLFSLNRSFLFCLLVMTKNQQHAGRKKRKCQMIVVVVWFAPILSAGGSREGVAVVVTGVMPPALRMVSKVEG